MADEVNQNYPPPTGKLGQEHIDNDGAFYHDGEKWVRTNIDLSPVTITAEGSGEGVAAFSIGLSVTGVVGIGVQSSI